MVFLLKMGGVHSISSWGQNILPKDLCIFNKLFLQETQQGAKEERITNFGEDFCCKKWEFSGEKTGDIICGDPKKQILLSMKSAKPAGGKILEKTGKIPLSGHSFPHFPQTFPQGTDRSNFGQISACGFT